MLIIKKDIVEDGNIIELKYRKTVLLDNSNSAFSCFLSDGTKENTFEVKELISSKLEMMKSLKKGRAYKLNNQVEVYPEGNTIFLLSVVTGDMFINISKGEFFEFLKEEI
jgi:hypothetical protein